MVGWIILAIYIMGVPLSFWLHDGLADFEHVEDETPHEKMDRCLAIVISVFMALCWPIFWALYIVIFLMTLAFRIWQ